MREIEREREREREKEKREKNVFTKHDGVANKLLPFLYVFYCLFRTIGNSFICK